MTPVYDIEIDQGADTERAFVCLDGNGNPMDFSGFTARMQIRSAVWAGKVIDELSTENGRLAMSGSKIIAMFPHAVTSTYPGGRSVYDLEIISGTERVYRLLKGAFVVCPEVTQ